MNDTRNHIKTLLVSRVVVGTFEAVKVFVYTP